MWFGLTQVVPPPSIATGTSSITLPTEGYTYDAVHNRKSSSHQTGSLANAWTYNSNHQLIQWGDPNAIANNNVALPRITQTFDVNGHLITKTVMPQDLTASGIQAGKQSHRYFYNTSERLIKVTDGSMANAGEGAEIASYAYNPFGLRIKKIVSQNPSGSTSVQIGATIYFYSDEGLIAEADGAGIIAATYGWMPNGTWGTAPVFKRDYLSQTPVEHYYLLDHLGSPQRLTNQAGEVTWRSFSEAFGKTLIDTNVLPLMTIATINNLRFPGQYEDEETGMRYNWNRFYDYVTGRYLQSDRIGLRGGINTYIYGLDNPVRSVDPDGRLSFSWSKTETRDLTSGKCFQSYPAPGRCESYDARGEVNAIAIMDSLSISAPCKPDCQNNWRLSQFIVDITFGVHLKERANPNKCNDAQTRRAEAEHIADYIKWAAGTARAIAAGMEGSQKTVSYKSNSECERENEALLRKALLDSFHPVVISTTAFYDTSGLHRCVRGQ